MIKTIDKAGSVETDPHYPRGWALAGNTPLKKWKQDTHSGGNSDPLIISWPARIKDGGGLRSQYHHLVDIVPTLFEISGLPAPKSVNGVDQMPYPGVSMAYTFGDAKAPTRKEVQYYEMLGSRAIWAAGWTAVAWHKPGSSWDEDKWELYETEKDFAETNDLAAQKPEKLRELKDLWTAEAKKYQVYPLDDRRYERVADPTRPVAPTPMKEYTYYPGTSIIHPLAAPQLLGRKHTITATVEIPASGAAGVLAAFGGEFGGWSLFVKDNRLHYAHNYLKIEEYLLSSSRSVATGKHELAVQVTPTETFLKPDYSTNDAVLLIDGQPAGELKGFKMAGQYSAVTGYGLQIGRNTATPVSRSYKVPFALPES